MHSEISTLSSPCASPMQEPTESSCPSPTLSFDFQLEKSRVPTIGPQTQHESSKLHQLIDAVIFTQKGLVEPVLSCPVMKFEISQLDTSAELDLARHAEQCRPWSHCIRPEPDDFTRKPHEKTAVMNKNRGGDATVANGGDANDDDGKVWNWWDIHAGVATSLAAETGENVERRGWPWNAVDPSQARWKAVPPFVEPQPWSNISEKNDLSSRARTTSVGGMSWRVKKSGGTTDMVTGLKRGEKKVDAKMFDYGSILGVGKFGRVQVARFMGSKEKDKGKGKDAIASVYQRRRVSSSPNVSGRSASAGVGSRGALCPISPNNLLKSPKVKRFSRSRKSSATDPSIKGLKKPTYSIQSTLQPGQIVALKVMSKSAVYKSHVGGKIRHEATLNNAIRGRGGHPFVVECFASFQDAERIFLALELVRGCDLFYLVVDKGHEVFKKDENAMKFYLAEIVVAVDWLHSCGLLLRDLKLENVRIDPDGHVKLIDFGVSTHRVAGWESFFQGGLIGTLCYQSPETMCYEWRLEHANAERLPPIHCWEYPLSAPDWWAVGIIAFEMLHFRNPWGNNTDETIVRLMKTGHPPPIFGPHCKNVSPLANDLLRDLLKPCPYLRLGVVDPHSIFRHPFFKVKVPFPADGHHHHGDELYGNKKSINEMDSEVDIDIDWQAVVDRKPFPLTPPFLPEMNRRRDSENWQPEGCDMMGDEDEDPLEGIDSSEFGSALIEFEEDGYGDWFSHF